MRIALINNRYPPYVVGGAEKVVQALAEGLVKLGHQVHILTTAINGNYRSEQIHGVGIVRIKTRNLYSPGKHEHPPVTKALWHILDSYNLFAAQEAKKWLQQVQPDLVHTHVIAGFSASIWKSIKSQGIPLIHTIHDQYILCPRTTMFRDGHNCKNQCLDCHIYSLPRVKSTRHVDTVIGVSQFILDHHRNYGAFSHSKQLVIYNGISSMVRNNLPEQASLKDSQRNFRFGYLGKINESKGIRLLIEAFHQLDPHLAELWIAGRGQINYEKNLRLIMDDRKNIRWLGFVDPEELLSNVDILVVPSLWNEPFGLVAVEAMAFGLPVIASNRGGLGEIISHDVGWIFDPDQPETLVELFHEVVRNKETITSLGSNALKKAKLFTREKMVSAYLSEYEKLLQKRYL